MRHTIIAPVGKNMKPLYVGIKAFSTEKIILLTPKKFLDKAEEVIKRLKYFAIKTEIVEIGSDIFTDVFDVFARLIKDNDPNSLLVNISTGRKLLSSIVLSSAYVNGLKAFNITKDKAVLIPIMKLPYSSVLSSSKIKILKALENQKHVSMQDLSRETDLSLSLVSYHIHGNVNYKGLKELRLVDVKEQSKNVFVRITPIGKLILKSC